MSEPAVSASAPLVSLDPITLIRQSDKADSTKRQYERAVRPYIDAGSNLAGVPNVAAYAATLGKSRRAHLRSAVSLWAMATKARIKASVTPEAVDTAQAEIMRLDALPEMIPIERSNLTAKNARDAKKHRARFACHVQKYC